MIRMHRRTLRSVDSPPHACLLPSLVTVCVRQLTGERLDELELPPMYVNNEDPKQTAFTVSVDLKEGTSTGISGADRAATFRALAGQLLAAPELAAARAVCAGPTPSQTHERMHNAAALCPADGM